MFVEKNDYGSLLKGAIVAVLSSNSVMLSYAYDSDIVNIWISVIVHVSVNNKDVIVSSDSNTIRIIVVPRTSIMLSSIPEKELSKV